MKKRLFSILTALALCLTLLPTAALADGPVYTVLSSTSFTEWDGTGDTPAGPYKKTTGLGDEYYLPAGYYKLEADISDISIRVIGTVTLDLNGRTLKRQEGDGAVLLVGFNSDPGHLTLTDSSEDKTGTVTGGAKKAISVNNGSLTLVSGTVCTSGGTDYAIALNENTTVTLKGGKVTAEGGSKAISIQDSAILNADGGTVGGPVENEYGTITHSAGATDTITNFTGTVTNKGTISGGTFTGTVTNKGIISGGTFNGTVINCWPDSSVPTSPFDSYKGMLSTPNSIINNGSFVFQNGYMNGETDITASNEDAKAAASQFISGLRLSGTGYVQVNGSGEGDSTYYSNSGTGIDAPNTKQVVTFDLNGGTGTIPPQGIYDRGTATRPTDPTREGYTFGGWYEKESGALKDTAFDFSTSITDDITLYAKWTAKTYTVTYLPGANGTGVVTAGSKTHGVGFTLSSETFTRAGYTQTSWATTDGGEKVYDLGGSYTTDADVTLHPVWTQNSSGGGSSRPSYAITAPAADNGTVKVSPRYAQRGDTVTITVTPDAGYTLETLTVLDKNGNEIELTNNGDGTYTFKMPAGKVEIKASFMEDNSMLNFFVDVPASEYYYDAVKWAVENGITTGINETEFGPDLGCTRAQIVTFLWRAAGCPEPKGESHFSDVSADAYYAKAVAWAVENGITGGIGGGKFAPDATCTRAQAVTFLYRAAGSPAVSSAAAFSDVGTDAYYANAVAWAAKDGITGGIGGGLFGSDNDCTRAQIVTFLYRSIVK